MAGLARPWLITSSGNPKACMMPCSNISLLLILMRNKEEYQMLTGSLQRMEAMNHTISELNQTNLRQQMNPHFIFNTLNSIQYYVFQNDKISSNNYMTKFASLIRKTLENSKHTEISIKHGH